VVGVRRALDLILSGRSVNPRRARAMGLADEVYPPDLFADRVLAFTEQVVAEHRGPRRARPKLAFGDQLLEGTKLGRMILFRKANEQVYATTNGHYPAPPAALAAIRTGIERGNRAGYAVEARSAAELLTSPVSRNLIGLFFQSEALKKSRGVADPDVEPRPVRDLGIIGAGIMGGGITHAATKVGLPVRLKDVKHEAILGALSHMRKLADREVRRRRATPAEIERRFNLVAPTLTYQGFRRADLIIEAVVEDLAIKQTVFKELESAVREDCIIASNTSSLSVTTMASALARPERFFGLHFFNPVDRMLLVEVVRGQRTDDETVATGFELAKRLGKTPIVVGDRPGFLVNRILMPYLNEGCRLLEEGFTIEIVDRAMKNFGMPMGPLDLLDEVGLDVAVRAATSLAGAYSDRLIVSPLLQALVDRGRLGKKNGLGFYRGTSGAKRHPDPEVARIVESLPPPVAGGTKGEAGVPELATSLQERLVLPMINEAARCLMEGVVRKPSDVDLGLVFGIGFPPFRGGLLRYADELEVPAVVDRLLAHVDEGRAHYAPAPLLVEMAEQGRAFYPDR
jgi:3-hydroxyacyl-CoA dehydrogenase/enoyl-CoA hydratase/3-hydroxybutyryl-CoA epimerase